MTQYCGRCGGIFSEKMSVEYGDDDKPYHSYCAYAKWKEERQRMEDDFNKRRKVGDQSSNSTLNLSEKTYGK